MKNKNNTQRNSPSSPNLSADNHEGAGEGLDVTACSASSFDSVEYAKMVSVMLSDNPTKGMGEKTEKWWEDTMKESCRRVLCGESDPNSKSIEEILKEY
jgi:hypothetical protein